jgi:hypothetical protein
LGRACSTLLHYSGDVFKRCLSKISCERKCLWLASEEESGVKLGSGLRESQI